MQVDMKVPDPALSSGDVYIRRELGWVNRIRSDGVAGPCGFNAAIR